MIVADATDRAAARPRRARWRAALERGAALGRAGWLRLAVSAGLLGALLVVVDLGATWQVLATADPGLLAGMALLMVGERLFAAYRWLVLLRIVDREIGYWPVLRVTLTANFVGSFLPGGVGIELLRIHGLARHTSDLALALSSVLVERVLGLLSLLVLIALGLLAAPLAVPPAVEGLVVLGFAALLATILALVHPWPRRLARLVLDRPALAPVRARLQGLETRIDSYLRRPATMLWSFLLAVAFQLLRVTTVVVGAAAFAIAADPLLFVVILPVTILVALLPISLGGLGPREATFVGLLGLAGVAPAAALVLVLTREAFNLATALPGAVLYARGPVAAARS